MKRSRGEVAVGRRHRAAPATDNFLVRGICGETEPRLIERLQQLISALEKERAQLRIAIFGKAAHVFASSRWYAVPLFSCTMRNFCVKPKRLSACPTKR